MASDVIVANGSAVAHAPQAAAPMEMTPGDVIRQVNLIQQVMQAVMKNGEHYGLVPGCGNKPALLKPGAEKLSLTFRLAPKFNIIQTDFPNGHREYRVTCDITNIITGQYLGSGVGSCSSMEGKYRFRSSNRKCPSCGAEAIIKGKQEYGGGWLCYKAKGGCGSKWPTGAQEIEGQEAGKVEHDNPADFFNTVLKMAKKRAHVDAILTVTAASDIFAQDIEENPELFGGRPVEAEPAAPPPVSDEVRKRWKQWRGKLNQKLLGCKTLEEMDRVKADFERVIGMGPAVWTQFSHHNETETFQSLADEHKARAERNAFDNSPAAVELFIKTIQGGGTTHELKACIKAMNDRQQFQTVEVQDALQEKAKELGFDHYTDLEDENPYGGWDGNQASKSAE